MSSSIETYRKNSLSSVKLLAAFQVMIGHLIAHFQLNVPGIIGYAINFFAGVPIFFVVSGYLIWLSIERSSDYGSFIRKRFWRLYPELWVAVGIEIISIIILYNGWKIKDLLVFTLTQGTILQFWTPNSLRGYGCGTPNGTLWTMCVMVQFYVVSWQIYKVLHNKKIVQWIMGIVFLVGISIVGQFAFERLERDILVKLYDQTIVRYCWLFFFGCFIAEYRDILVKKVLSKYWYILLFIAIVLYLLHIDINASYKVIHSLLMVSGLIGFAYAFPKFEVKVDISYGIFLYHMIIVNIFINLGLVGNWFYASVVFAITLLISFMSWKTIGTWANKMKVK